MTPVDEMRRLAVEIADYTGSAIDAVADLHEKPATPDQVASTHVLVTSYVNLARACLDSFQEAAGA